MRVRALLSLILSTLTFGALAPTLLAEASGPQLKNGRYVGYIQPDGGTRKIAATLNIFVVQPDDPRAFPAQWATLKASLGGPLGREYVTSTYDSVRYDFTHSTLTIDRKENDLTIVGTVVDGQRLAIEARAFSRAAPLHQASVHLEYVDDDDPDGDNAPPNVADDTPPLTGEYSGDCDHLPVVLQLETARGLADGGSSTNQGLPGYAIIGRLGYPDSGATCPSPTFCAFLNFHAGQFNIYTGQLQLQASTATDICQMDGNDATCDIHFPAGRRTCHLHRSPVTIPPAVYYSRAYWLNKTSEQTRTLPPIDPPESAALVADLTGTFTGYLHNESNNHYQLMRLSVLAAPSTDHEHNLNLVFVSGGITLHFGNAVTNEVFVQDFEPQPFYLTKGFTLQSEASDLFFNVTDWKTGYVTGVLYSHAFGRIGTVELLKTTDVPALPATANLVPSLVGTYAGPSVGADPYVWSFDLITTLQPMATHDISTLAFGGGMRQLSTTAVPERQIERGAYDFYTGAISWSDPTGWVITGYMGEDGTPSLFWPGTPNFGSILRSDHEPRPYPRMP